ncbi:MAG: hypothetical protein A3F72_05090 [Bacteroidetes bacterium RIFCSPLOWO2_12_FULL_35_15]|nr:MAG: hypothetical protein A3F72_05090 [Bacteroidetes bacterium RIFCSPLOWO2_12_FULL_35_15]
MKKIIIISYYYPPTNFVAAERTSSWVRHLHKYGYYPVIITRNWNAGQSNSFEKIAQNDFKREVFTTHELHSLPYNRNLRDKLFKYEKSILLSFFRKVLTISEKILGNFSISFLPYSNLFHYAQDMIKSNPGMYKYLIISGSPFQSFQFGYLLKKRYNIKWLPDYRDEWTIIQDKKNQTFSKNLMCHFDRFFEKKWTKNADGFITVTDYLVKIISNLNNKKGYKVMNGYEPTMFETQKNLSSKNPKEFIITYNGSIYKAQDFSIIINSLKQIIRKYPSIKIQVNFVGLGSDIEMSNKIKNYFHGYENNLNITKRINKNEVIAILNSSDLLLLTSYGTIKGWLPVKIFDYLAIEVPILLCPSDDDEMSWFIKNTNTGYIANSNEECVEIIKKMIEKKSLNEPLKLEINKTQTQIYTREYQAKILANVLDNFNETIKK